MSLWSYGLLFFLCSINPQENTNALKVSSAAQQVGVFLLNGCVTGTATVHRGRMSRWITRLTVVSEGTRGEMLR